MAALNHVLQIAMLLSLHPSRSAEIQSRNISIGARCNFAEPKFPFRNEMTVHTTMLASCYRMYCRVWYNFADHHVLRLWLQRTSHKDHRTYIASTVMDKHRALVLPGYVAQVDEHVTYPFLICLGKDESRARKYSIFLSAPPETGLSLTVQVDESMLQEGQTRSIELGYQMSSRLLVFNISSVESIYYDHFQVTVRSDDADEECLLVVSDECPNVVNIDPRQATDDDLRSALRLSFTTLGRVTLSHASKPQLKTGRWFIGVFLKYPRRGRNRTVMKTVRVSVGFAGGTQSYQVIWLAILSLFGGLAIVICAYICLNPNTKDRFLCLQVHERTSRIEMYDELILRPSNESPSNSSGIDSSETFAYTTAIAAFSLVTGAAQFIILYWRNMIDSGNRDICYYNDLCYRVETQLTPLDIPFNLIISNLPYVIHGFVLAFSVMLHQKFCTKNVDATKSYSIAYAFSWALVFEGIFSSFYHLCPTRMTFQFDSAFMFVMCALVVTAVFNSQVKKAQRAARITEAGTVSDGGRVPSPMRASKLFLFFFSPLLLLNYLGSIRDTNGFLLIPLWLFYCLAIVWIIAMFVWALRNLMDDVSIVWSIICCKCFWFLSLVAAVVVVGIYTINVKRDWSQFFLLSCLVAVGITLIGFCFTECSRNIICENVMKRLRVYLKSAGVYLRVVLYIVGMAACWAFALYFFSKKAVTDKVSLPSQSREFNKECVLWDYFDYHDLWHILSSFALLATVYFILWISA